MTADEHKRRLAALARMARESDLSRAVIPGLPIDSDAPMFRRRTRTAKEIFGAAEAAVAAALSDTGSFWQDVTDRWRELFPDTAARPGRVYGDTLYLYVPNAAANFANLRRLPVFKKKLLAQPGCPATLKLRLEIHS